MIVRRPEEFLFNGAIFDCSDFALVHLCAVKGISIRERSVLCNGNAFCTYICSVFLKNDRKSTFEARSVDTAVIYCGTNWDGK